MTTKETMPINKATRVSLAAVATLLSLLFIGGLVFVGTQGGQGGITVLAFFGGMSMLLTP